MEKSGYACLCLVFLATFVQCGVALSGSIHMFNSADYDMSIKTVVQSQGGSTMDPGYSPLPKGTAFQFQVTDGIDNVSTWFTLVTPSGRNEQFVTDWSSAPGSMQVPCTPNCYWIVDNNGFSVGNSESAQLQFVMGWKLENH